MTLTVEAIYENGVLKPTQPLPLVEHERVRVSVYRVTDFETAVKAVDRSFGMLRWTGSHEELDYLINDAENDPLEVP